MILISSTEEITPDEFLARLYDKHAEIEETAARHWQDISPEAAAMCLTIAKEWREQAARLRQ